LLLSKHTDSDIKIADFGFAAEVTSDNCLTDMCGTPNYVAPEVIKMGSNSERGKGYGLACDMWSVGVIIFVLLGGYPPFEDDDQKVWPYIFRLDHDKVHADCLIVKYSK
jgi:serine/threonine protein kinase